MDPLHTEPATHIDPAEAKSALREQMRRTRLGIPIVERAQMALAARERFLSLPGVRAAGTLLLFWSFGSEIDTHETIRGLASGGRRIVLPFVREDELEAAALAADGELVPSGYGPLEPAHPTPVDPAEIDVAVAPGLAFDLRGFRLGYGGGHFDRFLARLRTDALRVGLCFHAQVIPQVPEGPGDEPVDVVVTDRETFTCRRS
jgi:5-formyltetrahydrofolate cyclo-ligase